MTGKQFAKYWTHNGLIKVNGQKMSKSLGNSLLLEDLLKKYSAEAIKFALLQTNYRNDINITDGIFDEAEKHLKEFYAVIASVEKTFGKGTGGNAEIDRRFDEVMSDDFNTALALSDLFGIFKSISKKLAAGDRTAADDVKQVRQTYSLLGLFKSDAESYLESVSAAGAEIPEEIKMLAERRWQAKANKNWAEADALRNEIDKAGYLVKDGKDGYEIIVKG